MEFGSISIEYYVGRYTYLTRELDRLPKVTFGVKNDHTVLRFTETDPVTGKVVRRRISKSNPGWKALHAAALSRQRLERQKAQILKLWKEDYSGSLSDTASRYRIMPNTNMIYDSSMWASFKNNDCDKENHYPVAYKDLTLRSQFEVDVLDVLEQLGADYKYEVKLLIGGGKVIYPDVSVNLPEYNRCGFVEAMGGLDNLKYASHNTWKLKEYINSGLYPNRDVAIVVGDYDYRPDHEMIRRSIGVMLSAISMQYVFKLF